MRNDNSHINQSECTLKAPRREVEHRRRSRATRGNAQPKKRNLMRRWIQFLGLEISAFAFIGIMTLFAVLSFYASDLPHTDQLWRPDRAPRYSILAADGSPLSVQGTKYGAPVRLAELPDHVLDAVLAVEDRNFHHHVGVNLISVGRALLVNTGKGRVRQGGSTITQQLAKNLFLSSERTLKRKVQELLLAFWLEQRFSKNEILTLYLNRVYLGAGAYGIDAASYRYFGKSARELDINEAALIAGLLKAPSKYNPTHNPRDAGLRARTVIESMVAAEFLTPDQGEQAIKTPIYLKPQKYTASAYFVNHTLGKVKRLFPDNDADLIIQTTFDPALQLAVEIGLTQAIQDGVFPDESPDDVIPGAVSEGKKPIEMAIIIADGSGAIRAMIGGRDYQRSQFNRAIQARRQPGSAFKPFVFLAAIEAGAHPDNLILDAPITIGNWSPKNYKNKYYGEVTLTQALAKSLNSATIRLQEWVGRPAVLSMARAMGFEGKLNPDAALALGVDAVSPMELAQSWTPFINGGLRVDAHTIDKVTTAEGDLIYQHKNHVKGIAASRQSITHLNQMLQQVTQAGTGKNARVAGWPVAGKTGTTQGSRDAWFAGHMAGLVGVVWVGRDDYTPMKNITGGRQNCGEGL